MTLRDIILGEITNIRERVDRFKSNYMFEKTLTESEVADLLEEILEGESDVKELLTVNDVEFWIQNINHGLEKKQSGEGIIRKAIEEIQRILGEGKESGNG